MNQWATTVDRFLEFFDDIEKINYQKKIIVFDENYNNDELNKIYDLLKNKWKVNKLDRLDHFDSYEKYTYEYKYNYDLIERKIILVENCDLDVITDAYELFEYIREGYELWHVVSQFTQYIWDKEE